VFLEMQIVSHVEPPVGLPDCSIDSYIPLVVGVVEVESAYIEYDRRSLEVDVHFPHGGSLLRVKW
jgi:hypothetical protein